MASKTLKFDNNSKFDDYFENKSRYLVLMGGAGAGKSYFAAQKILRRLFNEPQHRMVIARKVARTIRNSQYLQIKDVARDMEVSQFLQFSESRISLRHIKGNEIISTGIDDPEKLKSLASPTTIWIEEATELSAADFRQLDLRLRGVKDTYMQIILTFNPVNKGHWLYRRFFANTDPQATVVTSTYLDNKHLDPDYRNVLEGLKTEDEASYKVYTLGQWGDLRHGLIYNYLLVEHMPECPMYIYGLDFGFNNPTALVQVGIKEDCLFIKELVYRKKLTNNDLIELLKVHVHSKTAEIYADAAEPARIEEIYRAGFNVHAATKDVLNGIDHVTRHKLYVTQNSTHLIDELDAYTWKTDRLGRYLDEPDKQNDHACDAMRYAIHTHFNRKPLKIYGFY